MRYTLSVLMVVLTMGTLKSQNNVGPYTFGLISSLKSPQTSDFMRYGNIPVNKFVGEPNMNIPLFNLKANQLGDDLSVAIGYNFSGFIPNKRPDILGLNWFLNVGGVISREVKSIPDDQKGQSQSNAGLYGMNKDGLIVGLRSKANCLPLHTNAGIFSFASSTGGFNVLDLDYKLNGCDISTQYDGDADIFSFNFVGKSGKFFLGNDGQVKIIGDETKGFKIDINNVATQPIVNQCKPLASEIKITDDEGNTYYFGGESKNLEYNVPLAHVINQDEVRAGIPVINAWHLRQIVYSNGETVNFNYKNDALLTDGFCNGSVASQSDWHGTITSPNIQERRKFVIYNRSYNQDVSCGSQPGHSGDLNYADCGGSELVFSVTKKAILENIATSNYTIKFDYSLQPYIFNYDPNELTYFQQIKNVKLDVVSLYNSSNQLINSFTMDYELKGGTTSLGSYPRLFLKSVTEQGKNPYLFSYNIANESLPKATSKQIDHWGFYNGSAGNENMIYPVPTEATDSGGDYYFTSTERDPDFTFSSKGILNAVTYPTKGSTSFLFEAPTYNYKILRKKVNGYMPLAYNIPGIAGGVRLQKITDYTDGTISSEKQYEYGDGVLLQWPRYSMFLTNGSYSAVYLRSSSMNMNVLESSVINYGKVTERVTGKGSTETIFSNYQTNPDRNDVNVSINAANPLSGASDLPLAINYIGLYYNDLSMERGKVLSEAAYDNLGKAIRNTAYTYNLDPQRFDQYSVSVHTSGPSVEANKLYHFPTVLTKKETTDYFYENGQVQTAVTKEDFSYSSAPDFQLTSTQTLYPDGSLTREQTTFAVQEGNNLLISKNMLGLPIENKVLKKQTLNDAGKIISYSKDVYPTVIPTAQTGSLILPTSVLAYNVQNDTTFTDRTYDLYDTKGNIIQFTSKDGQVTGIVWGYNKTLPIIKVEGKDAAFFMSSFDTEMEVLRNASISDIDESTEAEFIAKLDLFQKRQFTLDVHITTYTHNPLVGITSITPPSGVRELYKYDDQGRLQRVVDVTGKTLKEFSYNYQH